MSDCIFCKIARGEMDTKLIYEDDQVVAFNDMEPQAPVHLLIIPKKHISTLLDISAEDQELIGHIYRVAAKLARENDIAEDGFRLVSNCNENGGQSVYHIHFHLLGGRSMQWPPG